MEAQREDEEAGSAQLRGPSGEKGSLNIRVTSSSGRPNDLKHVAERNPGSWTQTGPVLLPRASPALSLSRPQSLCPSPSADRQTVDRQLTMWLSANKALLTKAGGAG